MDASNSAWVREAWDAIEAYGGPRREPREALAALEEAIQVIRLIWSGERNLRFEGKHYRLTGAPSGASAAASHWYLARRVRPAGAASHRPACGRVGSVAAR